MSMVEANPSFRVKVRLKQTDAALAKPRAKSAYMNGGQNPVFRMWPRTRIQEPRDDVRMAWTDATARAIDSIQNSGWLAGMIDQAVASTVGSGLRLSARPDAAALGISTQDAAELGRIFERRFEAWAETPTDSDIEGRQTFGSKQASALKSWFATGEILAEVLWRPRKGGTYGTKIRTLSPHRLTQTTNETDNLFQGVQMDRDGMPVGYRLTRKIRGVDDEVEFRARDSEGRAMVIHVFDGMPGQVRGITPLVPVLKVCRRFDQLSDATLTAALIQTLFAATIKSSEPTETMMQSLLTPQEQARAASTGTAPYEAWFEAQSGWYDSTNIDLGLPGRIAHLFPGQDMEFLSSNHPNTTYKDFAMHLLREMARCAGLTFEDATGDYTGATYSSVRMATSSIFAITEYRRKNVIGPFCQPIYESVIEEDIEAGRIEVPGGYYNYLQNRTAFCRAAWKGTAKPQADDLKLAKAHEVWRGMGVISDEMIAADLGVDIEDVYEARQREKLMRKEFGLDEPTALPAPAKSDEEDDGDMKREDMLAAIRAIPQAAAPVVNVAAPEIHLPKVDLNVNVPDIVARVEMPEQKAPVVHVAAPVVNVPAPIVNIASPKARRVTNIKHDKQGRIIQTVSEEE